MSAGQIYHGRPLGARDLTERKLRVKKWHELTCVRCGRPFIGYTRVTKYCDHPICTSARVRERKRRSLEKKASPKAIDLFSGAGE